MIRGLNLVAALSTLLALVSAGGAAAKEVLVVADPQDASTGVQLLEAAIAAELRHNSAYTAVTVDLVLSRLAKGANKELAQIESLRQAARTQFDNLEPDQALKQYAKVEARLEKAILGSDDLRPLFDTLAMVGAVNLLLGQEKKARASLEHLLTIAPDYVPDETVFNPQMMGVFASVSAKMKSTPGVDCEITTEPTAAVVYFDGRLVGMSPMTIKDVRKGRHYVSAELRGYERNAKTIEVKPKGTHNVSLKLATVGKRDTGTVELAVGAIEAIEAAEMPPEAKELVSLTKVDTLVLLQVTSSSASVAIYGEGGGRIGKTTSGEPVNLETARRMARELLGSLASAKEAPPVAVVAKATTSGSDASSKTDGKATDGKPTSDKPKEDAKADKPADSKTAAATTPGAPSSGATTPSSGGGSSKTAVVLGAYGLAAVAAAAGGVFGFLALRDQSQFNKITTDGGKIVQDQTTDQIEGKPIAARGKRNALIADILFGTAGAAAVTGLVIQLLWTPQPATTTVSTGGKSGWSLLVGPGYGSVTLRF